MLIKELLGGLGSLAWELCRQVHESDVASHLSSFGRNRSCIFIYIVSVFNK